MAFYKPIPQLAPIIVPGSEAVLRAPVAKDYTAWKKVRLASQKFLVPWEPKWPENDLTRLGFRRRLKRYELERELKTGATYFLVNSHNNEPIGGISISNIRYGAARACNIGYWMGHDHAGQGHMGRVLPLVSHHIFKNLGLCRIEAACLPNNERSSRLLLNAGFKPEGLLRKYLEINGTREDHTLFSLLSDEQKPR